MSDGHGIGRRGKAGQTGARLQRAAAAAWLAVVALVTEQVAQGLFSATPPAVLLWLGAAVTLQGDAPLWARLLRLLAVLVAAGALA